MSLMDAQLGEIVESKRRSRVLLVHITNLMYVVTLDMLGELFGRVGLVEKIVLFSKERNVCHALVQMDSEIAAGRALEAFDSESMFNGCNFIRVQFSELNEISVKHNNSRARDFRTFRPPKLPGCVVIAYNVDPEFSCEQIFNLFSIYGLVLRVKFLHSKPDAVLVQFSDPLFSSLAVEHLNDARLRGRILRVEIAHMPEIIPPSNSPVLVTSYPSSLAEGEGCSVGRFRAFTLRERRQGSEAVERVLRGACRPTALLHVANVASEATEADLKAALPEALEVRLLSRGEATSQMALAKFATAEAATEAVLVRHNALLLGRGVKLSFSKATF